MKKITAYVIIISICLFASRSSADELKENFILGQEAYNSGQYNLAIDYFEKVVEINSEFAPVYNALGLTYSRINAELSDVAWFFNVAVEIDPNYIDAYNNMCRVYYQAGEHSMAEESCLKVLEIDPNYGSAQLSLAWIYLVGKSQPNDAIYYFNEVLNKVQNPMVYFGLGVAYSMNGNTVEVLDTITTLRGMGEEQLASQLENTLRKYYDAPPIQQAPVRLAERQAGRIISGPKTSGEEFPTQGPAAQPGSGQMRIRLRGNLGTSSQASTTASGSAVTQGSAYPTQRSAVERIRELQRMRQLGITSTTNVP